LIGILSEPTGGLMQARRAMLIIVGGPQYRVGSHRQFVKLARAVAANGDAVMRFDVRGMGDSSGAARDFGALSDDVSAAIDVLSAQAPRARSIVLCGLCDGASAALLYLNDRRDRRVSAICLLNPWARSESTLARTHLKHYYTARLLDGDFWRKLLRGGVGVHRVAEFAKSLRQSLSREAGPPQAHPPFQQAMAAAWRRFEGPILLALSRDDLTAKEFIEYASASVEWRGLLALPQVRRVELEGADHTLSTPGSQRAFEDALCGWINDSVATDGAPQ
jgi:exosortase A-associated hydrolase 1